MSSIKLFESNRIRSHWDTQQEKWYFSVIDIIAILTSQPDHQRARNYWKVLKSRLIKEGNQTVTNCNRLKLVAEDGKFYSLPLNFLNAHPDEHVRTGNFFRGPSLKPLF